MRLLLTRPQLDAEGSRHRFEAFGHQITVAPLIDIRFLEDVSLPDLNWQALLVTSGNGARALVRQAGSAKLRRLPVLAVGDQSATRMREKGFANVVSANGDVEALAQLAKEHLDPSLGPVLHVAGSVWAGDLGALLGEAFDYHRIVLYEAVAATQLPSLIETGLARDDFDGMLFYSPRTARIFRELVVAAGLLPKLHHVTAYCLSASVARALPEKTFRETKIASEPKEAALIALLEAD